MKIITLTFLLFATLMLSAQDISDTQKTLITKRTATWCPNCGTWGWDFAKALDELENPNAILIRAHYSGDLKSVVADEITKNFDPIYQPEFYINEERQDAGSSTWSSQVDAFNQTINANADEAAELSLNIAGSVAGSTFSSTASAEVLTSIEGQYFMAHYILEDSVVNSQAGLGNDIVHNSVLRWSLSGQSFGAEILNGAADPGSSFTQQYDLTLDNEDLSNRNFRLLTVIWKKENDKYQVVNLHSTDVGLSSSLSSTTPHVADFKFSQDGASMSYNFTLERPYQNASIHLHSLDGQLLQKINFSAKNGNNEVSHILNNVAPNIVLVTITGDGTFLMSEKVLVH